jgi:hypothetical protein
MQKLSLIGIAVLAASLTVTASSAVAGGQKGGGGVVKTGTCSKSSTWKLKVKSDDGRVETEFEVDQNRVGKRWRVTLRDNGAVAFSGVRTTRAPSGSFTVRRLLAGSPGTDRVVASARALRGGETCRASIAF